ncbi:hypothetical protein [Stygiolobus caldivivus]|uniref:Uncharacterized protein n=1 Tax=Stygiolobus caldivivus TaxID=2824673 RepID=A0A8D5U4Q6_9CREN|nr:hypothetical protein [Stygiolobus caldivivus]BCU69050.1 hypothetical protein KN1_03470 [Stygiolobus caldivivus]
MSKVTTKISPISNLPLILPTVLLTASLELIIYNILKIAINNYDLLKYPLGLTQELPPSYWISEVILILSMIFTIRNYKLMSKRQYSILYGIQFVLIMFNTYFVFYFINPVFILSRDELGHSSEVILLLIKHTTLLNPATYQAYYPFGFIYGAYAFIFSGLTPLEYFIYLGPMIYPIFQFIIGYEVIRQFLSSPMSEIGGLVLILSSMPFYVAEWSPQLMSYNLLLPIFLLFALIVKRGGFRFIPLLIVLSALTGLTDIATFASAITIDIATLVFIKKIGKFNIRYIGYTALLTAMVYVYWTFFNPLASGALGGDHFLLNNLINVIESIFLPQATKNLVLPTSKLVYTFIPPSPYHFVSVASKLLQGLIFLSMPLMIFLYKLIRKRTNSELWLLFVLGSSLILMQSIVGLTNNVSNVLTRMIPQAMVFYTVILVLSLANRKTLSLIFMIFLILDIPLSVLGYAMIATSEHSPPAAFYGGALLGKYGIPSVSTYEFCEVVNEYHGQMVPPYNLLPKDIEYTGPYIATLIYYFSGPTVNSYEKYYNSVIQNKSIILNSGEMIVALKY